MEIIILILIFAVIAGIIEWVTDNIIVIACVLGGAMAIYLCIKVSAYIQKKDDEKRERQEKENREREEQEERKRIVEEQERLRKILEEKYRQPLDEQEIERLSIARRNAKINREFYFTHGTITANPEFRSSLNVEGRWDRVDVKLSQTLALLTDVLKYKRHEWYLWALADHERCKLIWANKGDDDSSCYYKGNLQSLIATAIMADCYTVICMHNHPHTQDRWWNLLRPSETDLKTCEHLKTVFSAAGLNFIDALCTQGNFIIYGYSICEEYWPKGTKAEEIALENNISEDGNRRLRIELGQIGETKIQIK